MKKVLCGGLMVTALTAGASAMAEVTNSSLTTKGYVDSGLQYVYGVASGAATAASNAATAATNAATAATQAQNTANAALQAANNAAAVYIQGDGITITDGTGENAGKKVVSVDVVSNWGDDKPAWAGGSGSGGSGSGE